jgi:agmatinase
MATSQTEMLTLPFTGLSTFLRSRVCNDLAALEGDIAVIGFPSDEGSNWLPGPRLGPRRLRDLSLRFTGGTPQAGGQAGFYDIDTGKRYLDYELRQSRIVDCGDVDIIYTRLDQTWANGTRMVRRILDAGAFPLVLGGDHGITPPVVAAFSEPLSVVHFDAHIDYQPPAYDVVRSHGNVGRAVSELEHVQRVVHAGIRSFRSHQQDIEDSLADGNAVLSVERIRRGGSDVLMAEVPEGIPVYVTIDVDSMDISLVPGTSAPEPGGFRCEELIDLLRAVAEAHEVVGFDLVEVNPMLDSSNQMTAFLGMQIIAAFLGACTEHPAYRAKHPYVA